MSPTSPTSRRVHHRLRPRAQPRLHRLVALCALAGGLAACGPSTGSSGVSPSTSADPRTVASPASRPTLPAPAAVAGADRSTVPAVTLPATTTLPPTPAPVAAPSTSTTPTTTTPAPTPTATTPAPTPGAAARPILALTADGDAVVVALDGSTTVLVDGVDPDEVVTEGPVTELDGGVITDDGAIVLVSECCEPSPGVLFHVDPSDPTAARPEPEFGHGPALSPDGTRVAYIAVAAVVVDDLALGNPSYLEATSQDEYPDAVVWADAGHLVVLDTSAAGTTLRSMSVDPAGVLAFGPSAVISTVPADRSPTAILAGGGDGVVYVADVGSNAVLAFNATTLAPVPQLDVTLDGPPLSVWIEDGEVRWIDSSKVLHVGDTTVPGSYLWVR